MGSESKSGDDSGCRGDEVGGQAVAQGVPATLKKVVQSVKEIVNCTEQEIYAVLKECDMDPNRAVERLLTQDTFHEVKSKRERRKEMKMASDSRTRSNIVGLSRGGRKGMVSDRSVRQSGLTHVTYNEHGKAVDKAGVGSVCPSVTSSTNHVVEKNRKSDYFSTDSGGQSLRTGLGPQPSIVGESKGHLSMADIVRMGRPSQDGVSHNHYNIPGVSAPGSSESSLSLHCQNHSEQQVFHDEQPTIERPITGNSRVLNMSASSNANGPFDHPTLQVSAVSSSRERELGAAQSLGNVASDIVTSEKAESDSACSNLTILSSDTGLGSHSNSYLKNTCSSDFCSPYERDEDVSPVASDFQRLSVRESKLEVPSSEDSIAVVIPNHLQALATDCSHLSFGTYNDGNNSASSEVLVSNKFSRSGLEEKSTAIDDSPAQFVDPSFAYNGDKQQSVDVLRGTARDKNQYFLSSPQQEHLRHIVPEEILEREYNTTASVTDPRLLKSHWVTPSLLMKQPDLPIGNHPTFPRELHADSNSVAGDVFAYLMSQSQPATARYSNKISSIGNTATTASEVMEPAAYALRNRSALPRDLTEQSSIHFQQLPDIKGYQPLPQNQSYMTSINAQQPFSGNTTYNHSPADMKYNLQQNRNEFLTSRLPPATARDAFGFGYPDSSFHSPAVPSGFLSNPSLERIMSARNFDEVLPSQHSGGHNFSSIQRHGGFSQWDYGAEPRSSLHREKTQHNFLAQQAGQASLSPYLSPGYAEHYQPQTPVLEELEQAGGLQDFLSKQLNQFWQQGRRQQ